MKLTEVKLTEMKGTNMNNNQLKTMAAEVNKLERRIKRQQRRVEDLKTEMDGLLQEDETVAGKWRILRSHVRRAFIPAFWRKAYWVISVNRVAFVAAAFLALRASAFDTNVVTITNSDGVVVSNAVPVRVTDSKLIYVVADGAGGGSVRLLDLPPKLQRRFGLNVDHALADEAKEEARKAQWAASAPQPTEYLGEQRASQRDRAAMMDGQAEAIRKQIQEDAKLVREGDVLNPEQNDLRHYYQSVKIGQMRRLEAEAEHLRSEAVHPTVIEYRPLQQRAP
jgi:hypothetical protein